MESATVDARNLPRSVQPLSGLCRALESLMRSHDFSPAPGAAVRDCAVGIEILRAAGLTDSDIHWLLGGRYLDKAGTLPHHGKDFPPPGQNGDIALERGTSFVLTERGAALVRLLLSSPAGPAPTGAYAAGGGSPLPELPLVPR